jgi:hypothetical protein
MSRPFFIIVPLLLVCFIRRVFKIFTGVFVKLFSLFTVCSFFSSWAFANTYVICGTAVDPEEQIVTGYELELSSEDDEYSGPVGKTWNLKLEKNSDWLPFSKRVVAKTSKVANDTIIEIEITQAQSASGIVGTVYKLIGLYNEQPILEKYTMGGFAGSIKIGTFQCLSAND